MDEVFKNYDYESDGFPGEYVYGDECYVGESYMDELWKRAPGNPDYWVSNKGRIYSSITSRFVNGTPTGQCGHIDLTLRCGENRVHEYIHRLVAKAFIPNPHKHPLVRHLDDDPSNNYVDNLAWGTQLDNIRDAIRNGRFKQFTDESREKAMIIRRTPIIAVNFETGEQIHFESQQEASRVLGINQSDINDVLKRRNHGAKGYYFIFESDELDIEHFKWCKKKFGRRLEKYTNRRLA